MTHMHMHMHAQVHAGTHTHTDVHTPTRISHLFSLVFLLVFYLSLPCVSLILLFSWFSDNILPFTFLLFYLPFEFLFSSFILSLFLRIQSIILSNFLSVSFAQVLLPLLSFIPSLLLWITPSFFFIFITSFVYSSFITEAFLFYILFLTVPPY